MTNNQPPPALPFARTVVIIRTKPPMAPISAHSGVLWTATIGDTPDHAVSVLGLGSEQRVCGPGDVVVIPGSAEHEARFREDTQVIDFFAPPREDFCWAVSPPT
jgi:hypothetical protein